MLRDCIGVNGIGTMEYIEDRMDKMKYLTIRKKNLKYTRMITT